ncbi:MAG: hypothetical protein LCI03_15830 [Actinobacteria bacterium]|nr:hypothetical protein [Actinomycetota bacterium]
MSSRRGFATALAADRSTSGTARGFDIEHAVRLGSRESLCGQVVGLSLPVRFQPDAAHSCPDCAEAAGGRAAS